MAADAARFARELYAGGGASPEAADWLTIAFRRAVRNGTSMEHELRLGRGWRCGARRASAMFHIHRAADALAGASPWSIAVAIDSKLRALRAGRAPRDAVDAELAAALLFARADVPATAEGLYVWVVNSRPEPAPVGTKRTPSSC